MRWRYAGWHGALSRAAAFFTLGEDASFPPPRGGERGNGRVPGKGMGLYPP